MRVFLLAILAATALSSAAAAHHVKGIGPAHNAAGKHGGHHGSHHH